MSEKCAAATRAGPRPATGPSPVATTGISDRDAVTKSQAGFPGDVGPPGRLVALDASASAGAVDKPDEREAELARHALRVALLAADRGASGAAPDGEVVAAH
jgi:hypothetical protein